MAKKKPPKRRVTAEMQAEQAVEEVMQHIDENRFATPEVSRSESIVFYRSIAEQCRERADTIKSEADRDDGDESR